MNLKKSLLLPAALFLALAVQSASASSQIQQVQPLGGGPFQMPAGDHVAPDAVSAVRGVEIRTRIPMGEKALLEQKAIAESGRATYRGDAPVQFSLPSDDEASLDPLDATSQVAATVEDDLFPSTQCNTNIATGLAPSDIHGAAGPAVLAVVTNVDIGIYNKTTCAMVSRVPLKTMFTGFTDITNQTLFDPRVIYDRTSSRFFVTVESKDNRSGNTDQYQYFAVSTTSGATAWHRYRFTLSKAPSTLFCKRAQTSFWDYPNVGKSNNRWFITANDFPTSGSATGAIMVIDKAPTLTGGAVTARCWNNLAFNIAPPIVLDSTVNQSVFLAPRSGQILRANHSATGAIGADTLVGTTPYTIPAWSAPPDAVQPNGQKLDSLDGRFQSASIQSRDRIWNVHAIASGTAPVVRIYRLQRSASTLLNTMTFINGHLFNPSFTTNSGVDGSPAYLNTSRTIPTCTSAPCLASIVTYSGPNQTTTGWLGSIAASSTTQFTGCNTQSRGSCRWGDYSSVQVDPVQAGMAWNFNQLINGTSQFNWFTRAVKEIYNLQN